MTDRGAQKSILLLLAVFALAALGCIALLQLIGDDSAAASRVERDAEPASAAPDRKDDAAPALSATDPQAPSSEAVERVEPSIDRPARVEETKAEPVVITGSVKDANGGAVASAVVELRVSVRDGLRFVVNDVARTTTDALGSFRIETDDPRCTSEETVPWIVVSSEGRFGASVAPGVFSIDEANEVDPIQLEPGGTIRALALDESGAPIEGVEVSPHGAPALARRTGKDGVAVLQVLKARAWTVSAVANGYATAMANADVADGGVAPLTLRLPRGEHVSGVVVDGAGRPLSGVAIAASGRAGLSTTDEAGAFSLDALSKGTVTLRVLGPGFQQKQIDGVLVPSADLKVTLDAPLAFTGKIVDTKGAPVVCDSLVVERVDDKTLAGFAGGAGFVADLTATSVAWREKLRFGPQGMSSTPQEGDAKVMLLRTKLQGPRDAGAYVEADGTFRVYGRELSGCVLLVARSEEYGFAVAGPFFLTADPAPAPREVRIQFGGGCTLGVTVATADGAPVANADVTLVMFGAPAGRATTNADGLVRFEGLCDGLASAVAIADDPALAPSVGSITLKPGEPSSLGLVLSEGVSVDGIVRDARGGPLANAKVAVTVASEPLLPKCESITDASGRFVIEHVAVAKCTFTIEPARNDMLFAEDLMSDDVGLVSTVALSKEPRQTVELATLWPAPSAIATRFLVAGNGVDVGSVEIRRETRGAGYRVDKSTFEIHGGLLSIPRLAPGHYVLAVHPSGGAWYASPVLTLSPGDTFSAPIAIATTGPLVGRVEDEKGSAVAGASVYTIWKSDWQSRLVAGRAIAPYSELDGGNFLTTTSTDGSFKLPPAQLDAQSIVITARGKKALSVKADAALSKQAYLTVKLEPTH